MAIDYLTAKVHQRTLPRLCPDQPLTFRRDVVGTIFTAPVLRDDGGDYIKVQLPGDSYTTSVHFTQVVSFGDVPAPAEMPSETAIAAPPARLEASKPFTLAIRPIDPAIAKSRYEALAAERYSQWQVEKNYLGDVPLVDGEHEQLCKIADAHQRYGAAMRHLDRVSGTQGYPCLEMHTFDAMLNQQHIEVMEADTRVNLRHVGLFDALAIAALVELGTDQYRVGLLVSDSLHYAIGAAMDTGQLRYCQDVIGSLPTAPGRGVNLARGLRYYAWPVQQ